MNRLRKLFLDTDGLTIQDLEAFGLDLASNQKGLNWWIGDVARAARRLLGDDNYSQAFPPDTSPGLIQRCEGVARAYPREEDRNPLATWTIHKQYARKPDRIARVQAAVDAGRTSDEEREAEQEERAKDDRSRWLLAVDVHYHLHRHWFSGAGVEAAVRVAEWVQRTVRRLKEKGLTDVACCFEGSGSVRKRLTEEWEDKYKARPPKEPELIQQLHLIRELLASHGFACVSQDEFEADDIMASYAAQFPGKITLLSADKDLRQCLSDHCNILLDIEWTEDQTSGDLLADYKWLTAKDHTESTGIRPDRWAGYQAIMGDTTDGIKGAPGIGAKGAADLIKEFGTAEAAIQAAKADDERIKPKQREALIEFEAKLEVTRKLVTLVDSLSIPDTTRI